MFATTKQKRNGKGFQANFFSSNSGPKIPPSLIPIAKEDFSSVNWNNLPEAFDCDFDQGLESCGVKQWHLRDDFDFELTSGGSYSRSIGRDTNPVEYLERRRHFAIFL